MEKFKGMMTSLSTDWATPKWLYDKLNEEFKFNFDPCPLKNPGNIDGLNCEWGSRTFVNPPYGRTIKEWIKKCYLESLRGRLVVALLPSRTDTYWWHTYVMKADEIRYIKGRLKFGGSKNSAPFPSCVIVFKPKEDYD